MDLHNSTHWMEDEAVQSIDKRKLEFIASLFQSFQGSPSPRTPLGTNTRTSTHIHIQLTYDFKIHSPPQRSTTISKQLKITITIIKKCFQN